MTFLAGFPHIRVPDILGSGPDGTVVGKTDRFGALAYVPTGEVTTSQCVFQVQVVVVISEYVRILGPSPHLSRKHTLGTTMT